MLNPSTPFNSVLASAWLRPRALGECLLDLQSRSAAAALRQRRCRAAPLSTSRSASSAPRRAVAGHHRGGAGSMDGARRLLRHAATQVGRESRSAPAAIRRNSVDFPTPLRPSGGAARHQPKLGALEQCPTRNASVRRRPDVAAPRPYRLVASRDADPGQRRRRAPCAPRTSRSQKSSVSSSCCCSAASSSSSATGGGWEALAAALLRPAGSCCGASSAALLLGPAAGLLARARRVRPCP